MRPLLAIDPTKHLMQVRALLGGDTDRLMHISITGGNPLDAPHARVRNAASLRKDRNTSFARARAVPTRRPARVPISRGWATASQTIKAVQHPLKP